MSDNTRNEAVIDEDELKAIRPDLGLRVGGTILLCNVALTAVYGIVRNGLSSVEIGAAILDLVIGLSVRSGNARIKILAVARLLLGLIAFGAQAIQAQNWLALTLVAGSCAGPLLVLLGRASPQRVIAGAAMYGVYVAMALVLSIRF